MTKDEALRMAIAEIEGWIDHAYGHTPEECADNKAIKACKEALEQPNLTYEDGFTHGYDAHLADYKEQPTQEPVAWMHYKNFDLIYHDVWEELLEGKDEWYPLDYYVNSQLHRVVINHVEDLRKCIPALKEYPQMESTVIEVKKAINELEEALYTHPMNWNGLTAEEINSIPLNKHTVQAVENLLRSKNKCISEQ